MAASELPQWRAADDLVVVDVRPADDFRRVRIPGSINVRAHALKTKTFLARKRILLVNNGGSGAELDGVCDGLRHSGFATVGVLEGGLTFWSRHLGHLDGDFSAERSLNHLSPARLAGEVNTGGWLLVDVSTENSPASEQLLPQASRIPGATGERLRSAIDRALDDTKGDRSNMFVLVANGDGEGYDGLEADLESLGLTHLYFLEGGVEGYRAYENQRKQIAMSAARGCPTDRCGAR